MKDSLGVSPSKGNRGTTRGKEKILLISVGQRKSGMIKVVNRGEEKVRVHMNVVPRSTMNTNGGTEN